jgi:DNA adenine methylase
MQACKHAILLDSIAENGDAYPMAYPGGKAGAGVYQTIINQMPPHHTYIEPFLGGGAVMRLKRPATLNIGIDLDAAVIAMFDDVACTTARSGDAGSRFCFNECDALTYLRAYPYSGGELVYCDPPYMHRTRGRINLYAHEMTDEQHAELLEVIKALPCRVMISGYWTRLYADMLTSWRHTTFQAMTRAGRTATESLWCNFAEPLMLHDYRYLGSDFRERERIKRKKTRWVTKLKTMPALERHALLAVIDEAWCRSPH